MYYFLVFLFYSFIGYIVEMTALGIENKKIANRGFLTGPIIPVFGIGVMLLISLLDNFKDNIFLVFILGVIITGLVENFTGLILEKIFHNKWWDYSHRKDNINGRLCWINLILFGIAAVIIVCYFHPWMINHFNKLSELSVIILGWILMALFIMDVAYSVMLAYKLRSKIIVVEKLKNEKIEIIKEKLLNIHLHELRFFRAFPHLSKSRVGSIIKERLENHKEKQKNR